MTGANNRTAVGSGSGEWQTPPALFARLNRTFRFDYDAFASHENALCEEYTTTEGRWAKEPDGDRVHWSDHDGLTLPWLNRRVWMNPEYGRGFLSRAMAKAAAERNNAALIVALIPDARDTAWWRNYVAPFAIDIPIGRVRFINPETGQPGGSPPGGSVIALYFPDWRTA